MNKYWLVGGEQNKIESFFYKIFLPVVLFITLILILRHFFPNGEKPEYLDRISSNNSHRENGVFEILFYLLFVPIFIFYHFFEYKRLEFDNDKLIFDNIWHKKKIYKKEDIQEINFVRNKRKNDVIKWVDIYLKSNPKDNIPFRMYSAYKAEDLLRELKDIGFPVTEKTIVR